MSKQQINFRLPSTLIAALRSKAETEEVTVSELVTRLLQQGLRSQVNTSTLESRIADAVVNRMATLEELRGKSIV